MVSQLYTLWRGKKLRDEVDSVFRSSLLEDVLYVALDRGERDEVSRRDLFICVAEEDVRQELDFCIREFVLVREAGSDRSKAIEILECLRMVSMGENGPKEQQDMWVEFFQDTEIVIRKSVAFILGSKKSNDDLRMLLRGNPMIIELAFIRIVRAFQFDCMLVIAPSSFRKGLVRA